MRLELIPGHYYFDGKLGVRELVSVDGETVQYRILAAKQERTWGGSGWQTNIGDISSCLKSSFLTWAKEVLDPATAGNTLLLKLKAQKIKWTPTEVAFLNGIIVTHGQSKVKAGFQFALPTGQGRVARALTSKGALGLDIKADVCTLTPLGVAATVFVMSTD